MVMDVDERHDKLIIRYVVRYLHDNLIPFVFADDEDLEDFEQTIFGNLQKIREFDVA